MRSQRQRAAIPEQVRYAMQRCLQLVALLIRPFVTAVQATNGMSCIWPNHLHDWTQAGLPVHDRK